MLTTFAILINRYFMPESKYLSMTGGNPYPQEVTLRCLVRMLYFWRKKFKDVILQTKGQVLHANLCVSVYHLICLTICNVMAALTTVFCSCNNFSRGSYCFSARRGRFVFLSPLNWLTQLATYLHGSMHSPFTSK